MRRRLWVGIVGIAALVAVGVLVVSVLVEPESGGGGFLGLGGDDTPRPGPDPRAVRAIRALTRDELVAFASDTELDRYLHDLEAAAEIQREVDREWDDAHPPEPTELMMEAAEEAPSPEPASAQGGDESITNTQEAGVDEGGIVKTHGEHLVILRRGRLFSVRLGEDGALTPLSKIDAYPAGASGGWYDEMLIHGDTIVVVGFNYRASGTELGMFHIDGDGVLTREGTYYLRSNDYYSDRNYASRLVGDTLLFYMPYAMIRTRVTGEGIRIDREMPGVRNAARSDWDTIIEASGIYRPIQPVPSPVLHTVVACDLSQPGLHCVAQGILGARGRSFYVSPHAVYVWVGPDPWETRASDGPVQSVVYRLPLRRDEPVGAMRVLGMPIDQLSFSEQGDHLAVLVRAEGGGDGMWAAEVAEGDLALMRVPLAAFSDGVTTAPRDAYTPLPPPVGGWPLQNRFVGEHLLYGGALDVYGSARGHVYIHPVAGGETTDLEIPHGAERIEALGERAVVIGSGRDGLHFTAVGLGGVPSIVGSHVRAGASQGERRTHGFFYRASSPSEGTLGLPIRHPREGRFAEYEHGSAGIVFLHVEDGDALRFDPLGTLDATGHVTRDACVASCTDWYGNARPIFYRGRTFALLGYELVEGRVSDGAIAEVARTNLFEDQPGHAVDPRAPDGEPETTIIDDPF